MKSKETKPSVSLKKKQLQFDFTGVRSCPFEGLVQSLFVTCFVQWDDVWQLTFGGLLGSKTFSFVFVRGYKLVANFLRVFGCVNQPCASFECDVGGPSWSAWVSKLKIGCRYGDTLPILWYLEVSDTKKDLRNAFFSEFYEDLCLADFFFKVIFEMSILQELCHDVEHWSRDNLKNYRVHVSN